MSEQLWTDREIANLVNRAASSIAILLSISTAISLLKTVRDDYEESLRIERAVNAELRAKMTWSHDSGKDLPERVGPSIS